jgi:hypothetical protein
MIMNKQLFSILALFFCYTTFAQFTTGTVTLTGNMTVNIETSGTFVTLTITGPDKKWLGIGFGGSTMASANDMFIWNSTANRDYTSTGQSQPTPDTSTEWTVTTDEVASSIRTVIAVRPLASTGDYTFSNSSTSIPIIYAWGSSEALGYHAGRSAKTLTRTSSLGIEDFSLKATSIYPNPASGKFYIKTKTNLSKVNLYNQIGALVRTINVTDDSKEVELSVSNVQAGVYFLELQNDSEKSWKKVIVN